MSDKTKTPGLAWDYAILDIPEAGLVTERAAEPEERDSIAGALELLACPRLRAQFSITRQGETRYRVSGSLDAEVMQTCGVSLEPISREIRESFDVEFRPQREIPAPANGQIAFDDAADPEPIVDGRIEVGRVVFECLAGAIDPFPRKSGVVFEWQEVPGEGKSESPFAVLAKIKGKE